MLERGQGCRVWDVDGNEYLDFLAGIAVNSLGHAHPALVEAISDQAAKLVHVSNYFATPPQLELAERLKRISGAGDAGRVYFGNSGAEANEAAFKLARLNRGADGRKTRILALKQAFHGRTMGALALTGKPALQEDFLPMIPGVEHIDTSIEALEHAIDDTVAALFIEPIKGEAGVVDLPEGFLAAARRLTEQHGALLILDEIQTGVGRTGSWFAFQQHDIVPDAITVAKGIAGGFPIGALVTFGWASDLFSAGQHGSTFGGNPLGTRRRERRADRDRVRRARRGRGRQGRADPQRHQRVRLAARGGGPGDRAAHRRRAAPAGRGRDRRRRPRARPHRQRRRTSRACASRRRSSSTDAEIDEFLAILAQSMASVEGAHQETSA